MELADCSASLGGPRLCQRTETLDVNFCVNLSGVWYARWRRTSPISPMDAPARSIPVARECRRMCDPLKSVLGARLGSSAANNRTDGAGAWANPDAGLGSDEQTPCRAGRAMVAEVDGHGFADISGKGKTVVIAALAPHRQHADPPIDVIEFQREDLARPQPQAGQKEDDGAIAAVGAVVPLASTDNPFDLLGVRCFGGSADRRCGTVGDGP